MKRFRLLACAAMVLGVMPSVNGGETHNLNAEWRFSWAKETIPLKQALASLEKNGVAVSQPAYDDSGWEVVSLPHPVNAHDSFDNHAVVGAIIRSTWTCPIRMTFTIGKDTNTLFIPVYFTRNRSPFIGIEFFASGKKIEIQSVERIIETDKIRTQCAFLVPSQTNEMRYKGNIDWNEVFWGKDKLITVAP